MIIRLYKLNQPTVRGTINTSGTVPSASGTGEPILEAWLKAHEDVPVADATRSLESFFAAWGKNEDYSQVDEPARLPEGQA